MATKFDLSDLQLLLHIAEMGSITAGAKRANLSLAAASARVHGMELALGVPILERGRRGVQPTAAGVAAVHHARLVFQQIDRMHVELGEHAEGLRGQLKLLTNTAALSGFLPDILSDYLMAHPTVDLSIEEMPSQDVARAIADGRADIGFLADYVDMSNLETFPFQTDHLVLVASCDHPLMIGEPVALSFASIFPFDYIGLADGSSFQKLLSNRAESVGKKLRYRVKLQNFDTVCRMVERGVGITVIPETAAMRCCQTMRLAHRRLSDDWATRHLRLCVRRFDDLPAHAKRLVHLMRNGTNAQKRCPT